MRKTKIIATIGPKTQEPESIEKLIVNGANVLRINMSHGNLETHQQTIDTIKSIRKKLGLPVAIMIDTKGPEIRLGLFDGGEINLEKDQIFTLTTEKIMGTNKACHIKTKDLIPKLKPNDKILANNGLLELSVLSISNNSVECKVITGGKLSNNKSLNVPGVQIYNSYLTKADQIDLKFAAKNDVEFIAASFVSNCKDIDDLRKFLQKNKSNARIVAKIENQFGINNIFDIIKCSDGVMVARGDLGVEVDLTKIPTLQKQIITACRDIGKPVIVATEMLESMIEKSRPTRAEVSDISTAIFDGTSAIMLSGETAVGKYPIESLKIMAKIAENTESEINYSDLFFTNSNKLNESYHAINFAITEAIAHSAIDAAIKLKCTAIGNFTHHGNSTIRLSRYCPPMPIIALTYDEKVFNQCSLYFNTYPLHINSLDTTEKMFSEGEKAISKLDFISNNDKIVFTSGTPVNTTGSTNVIKISTIIK